MERLKQRYQRYAQEAIVIRKKAAPLAGIFGMGNAPQNDPAHVVFYEDVQAWVEEFVKSNPGEDACFEAVKFIVCAPAEMGEADSCAMMFAAQGLTRALVKALSREHCTWLLDFYDAHYPVKQRMPVHRELYKLLKKTAGR